MRGGDASRMSTEALDRKALAAMKLRERRQRIRRLRRTVVAVAVTLFVALWAVVFTQLVTGHDPVLAAKAQTASAASTSSGTGSTGSSGSATSASGSTGSSSGTSSSGTTSSVTTGQS